MKRLARSSLSDKHCWQCDTLLVSGTIRRIDGGMHYCLICQTVEAKERAEEELFWRLLLNKVE